MPAYNDDNKLAEYIEIYYICIVYFKICIFQN